MAEEQKPGLLHQPDFLLSLAAQLRSEAVRAEARALRLRDGIEKAGCDSGCWNLLSTCIQLQPI
ncbi:hypothetical protein ABIA24_004423 [Sinorhizobium fredii]|uniref:hypothetical protein n=1 Tax=Rhizobium fredii TaxID=380 RepID=UPI0010A681B4|nr:hypothetical protein [Sinorhizobium fredii]THK33518.1 hypothetical protein EHS39_35890 [Ensifer sp. MPMI2T]UTY47837.1 hypothetical protein EPK84_14360 [Sinorhizobium fredii]